MHIFSKNLLYGGHGIVGDRFQVLVLPLVIAMIAMR
jgi:hypothetical protein